MGKYTDQLIADRNGIVKKNIMNLKSSTLKKEYFTEASTVKEFLIEMIKKN